MVSAFRDFEVVGEASNASEAADGAKSLQPDVVLLDLAMPGQPGSEAVGPIREAAPGCRILMLSQHVDSSCVETCISAGADGFLAKTASAEELEQALSAVVKGCRVTPRETDLRSSSPATPPTQREREILQLIVEGMSSRMIASELGISVRTAEAHRANLMQKVGCTNVVELVRYAIRSGMILP